MSVFLFILPIIEVRKRFEFEKNIICWEFKIGAGHIFFLFILVYKKKLNKTKLQKRNEREITLKLYLFFFGLFKYNLYIEESFSNVRRS